jgi:hypothetical protein
MDEEREQARPLCTGGSITFGNQKSSVNLDISDASKDPNHTDASAANVNNDQVEKMRKLEEMMWSKRASDADVAAAILAAGPEGEAFAKETYSRDAMVRDVEAYAKGPAAYRQHQQSR